MGVNLRRCCDAFLQPSCRVLDSAGLADSSVELVRERVHVGSAEH